MNTTEVNEMMNTNETMTKKEARIMNAMDLIYSFIDYMGWEWEEFYAWAIEGFNTDEISSDEAEYWLDENDYTKDELDTAVAMISLEM